MLLNIEINMRERTNQTKVKMDRARGRLGFASHQICFWDDTQKNVSVLSHWIYTDSKIYLNICKESKRYEQPTFVTFIS